MTLVRNPASLTWLSGPVMTVGRVAYLSGVAVAELQGKGVPLAVAVSLLVRPATQSQAITVSRVGEQRALCTAAPGWAMAAGRATPQRPRPGTARGALSNWSNP